MHTRLRTSGGASQGRGEAGFTLVEIAVALAVLSVCLGVLLSTISNGVRRTAEAERAAEAGSLAQSLLAKVGSELPIREGEAAGQFADGLRWRVRMERYGDAADRQQWPVSAYRISAEVSWGHDIQDHLVVLTTLRLGPKATAP